MLSHAEFERLYVDYERPLFNIAWRWTWNDAEAIELVQEAFVRLWARRHQIEAKTSKAYLFKVVINLAQKHARRRDTWQRVRQRLAATPALAPLAARLPDQQWQTDQLRDAIVALPNELRQVLVLTEYSDLSQREIATLLGIPVGTVGSRRHSAVARLKEQLKDD